MRSFWRFIFLSIILVGLYFTGRQLHPLLEVHYWKQQLAEAPDEQIEILLDRIVASDDAGIPFLVDELASEREAIALAAKQRLFDQLDREKSLPSEEYTSRMLRLAESLSSRVSEFGPMARGDAAELTMHILGHSVESIEPRHRARVISACGDVLRTTTAISDGSVLLASAHGEQNEAHASSPAPIDAERWNTKNIDDPQFDPLPGGGLPIGPPSVSEKQPGVLPRGVEDAPPSYFQEPAQARALEFSNRQAELPQTPETNQPRNGENQSARTEKPFRSMSHEDGNVGNAKNFRGLNAWATLDLLKRLHDAEGGFADDLRAELDRRGFSKTEIDLGRRLFDPDPAERKRLVEELSGMEGIDASEWLLQCCKDESAEVRLSAFSLLATSANPLLLSKVKELAQGDADSRISRIADKIDEGRKK